MERDDDRLVQPLRRGIAQPPATLNERYFFLNGPLPTVTLTLAPFRICLPAFGLCPMTLPFFLALEAFLVTLPTLQWAFVIAALALASDLPTTFGTMQLGGASALANVALTE